jgi:integrase
MPYQYVREPLTADESDRLSKACETPIERLVVWTLLDTGLRVGELCDLTRKNVLWQQRQLRFKGKGGPNGKKTKVRVVPMSNRVRALLAPLRAGEGVPCQDAARPGHCFCVRTGSGIREALPRPRALPPPRTTWAKSAIRVYSMLQSKWLLRAPFAL